MDIFVSLAEQLFYKNQLGFFDFDKEIEDLEEEEFEVVKGDFKTIITLKFNKEGFPVSRKFETLNIRDENRIKEKTNIAGELPIP